MGKHKSSFNQKFRLYVTDQKFPPAMSILSYNGGAVVAMKGKNCVALASDLRYGVELRTVTTDFPKVFEITPHLWVGLPGNQAGPEDFVVGGTSDDQLYGMCEALWSEDM